MKKWITITGFKNVIDNIYQVSYGGLVRKTLTKELLHMKIANKRRHPYYAVYLHTNDGKGGWVLVHQLVATFFCKKPIVDVDVELVPDHLDNNGLNNHFTNLEWKSRSENTRVSIQRGEINNSCENGRNAVIDNRQAHAICKLLEQGLVYSDIINALGLPNNKKYRSLLTRIKNRLAWNDISKNYIFNSNDMRYSDTVRNTVEAIPRILKLIDDGYGNLDIAKIIWGENNTKLKSKSETVRKIRNGEIFKDYLFKNVQRSGKGYYNL